MAKRFIDLSIAIEPDLPSDPPDLIPKIEYLDHETGAESMKAFFPGIRKEDLPGGLGWAVERVSLATHSGTHLDAPYHYHPTMSKGQRSLTIDEIPLEWCYAPGVRLDFRHKADGDRIMVDDIKAELDRIGHDLREGEIVLARTGAADWWGKPEYLVKGAGFTRESTLWILDHGIRIVGTDAWSWDRPLPFIAQEFQKTKDPSIIWEGHFAGIERGYMHIEKLTNLESLPDTGFTMCCFPIKIKGASGGWIRAVAIVEE
ncbi:MAG: cyclase family protein [Proteobacteria bacterium]|nr:cyclase family protein [Pseudomonadota bacterium]